MREYDVAIVGGSYSGLSAALQLVRARRSVLVIDGGEPRNRRALASHGYLTQDGSKPRAIISQAMTELRRYPTFTYVRGLALSVAAAEGFVLRLSGDETVQARRIILALGVRDQLPDIVGVESKWGDCVAMCPYCHAYEFSGQPLGVIGGNAILSPHQAELLPDWGPTTYFTQGMNNTDSDGLAKLAKRGVAIERTPVVELLGQGSVLEAVRLADDRVLEIRFALAAPKTEVSGSLASQLGCELEDGFTGQHIKTDDWKQTSVPGVYAIGDASSPYHVISVATTSGTMAGVSTHGSLIG